MAEKRAAFILRRFRSLGFSKCRWLRTSFNVPSRSIFFFNRRRALSTGSPFFNLISVKNSHFLSRFTVNLHEAPSLRQAPTMRCPGPAVNRQKQAIAPGASQPGGKLTTIFTDFTDADLAAR